MKEVKKDMLVLTALLAVLLVFFSRILFTDQIIRAPDIINEFYWWALDLNSKTLWETIRTNISTAGWDIYTNGGASVGGGTHSVQFLYPLRLVLNLIPRPANVAWLIVMQLFFGAAGTYTYCRIIGCSRLGSFFSGLVFALATENASLINAGHVMKIATISYAPWAFVCLEKGYLSRRPFWFMATAVVLAFQFFNTHWQIAYYTCLCVGLYGIIRTVGMIRADTQRGVAAKRLLGLNIIVLLFFLSTVAISLMPLANWSRDTNRGTQSGANQGQGGLEREEAMSWSLPPEEAAAFVIPGLFGYSRQEAGPNPSNIQSYYWGRMVFTQTLSYMGLLPWLLVPLPLIFRRDRYTWLAMIAIIGGVLFSMGKYTPFYNLLYDYFPGINRFRVPKMIMFIPVMGLALLSARGIDLLRDNETLASRTFKKYLAGVMALPLVLLLVLAVLKGGSNYWIQMFIESLAQPTRYEQGSFLVMQRWNNLLSETAIAAGLAAACAGSMMISWRLKGAWLRALPILLVCLYLADVWRVNDKFMFLVDAPEKGRTVRTPAMQYILQGSEQYRTLPMDGSDPAYYITNKIPVMFTSNPVQQRRWQEFLDSFNLMSPMPDMLNVRYLVYSTEQYVQDRSHLDRKYRPVYQSPDGRQVVLENLSVLPKAWLVPSAIVATGQRTMELLQAPGFDPRRVALVETAPPVKLADPGAPVDPAGSVHVERFQAEQISVTATVRSNTLLVLGEKYFQDWRALVDGHETPIVPVNHVLRGIYLTPGNHAVEFIYDPLPFKIGKYLTLSSLVLFAGMLIREWLRQKKGISH
ncbi:YfhO family protein [Pelotalea chapellei]|uniref:YfhO family protein n=1 Tax=Pelotalea chapellei TaxID=44671 RepID=A0ABS5UA10_9BACT|nr:YfhO family protein [Pelotalea chapellei]MBT1072527.1 YfhO family protein [Pelotalea chapellei]